MRANKILETKQTQKDRDTEKQEREIDVKSKHWYLIGCVNVCLCATEEHTYTYVNVNNVNSGLLVCLHIPYTHIFLCMRPATDSVPTFEQEKKE